MGDKRSMNTTNSFLQDILFPNTDILCHSEFFKYTQWHNNAFSISSGLNIHTHIVHYEDYNIDTYNNRSNHVALDNLLDFLELKKKAFPPKFKMKSYEEYFEMEDRIKIANFIRELSSNETIEQVERYLSKAEM